MLLKELTKVPFPLGNETDFSSLLNHCYVMNVGNYVGNSASSLVVALRLLFSVSTTISRIKFRCVIGSGGTIPKYKSSWNIFLIYVYKIY